jgi:hypothetical protein
VGGDNFHAVQTGPDAHPATSAKDTVPLLRAFARRGPDHSNPSTAEVQNGWSYTSASPLCPHWHVWVTFTFTRVSNCRLLLLLIHYYRFLSLVIELGVTQPLTDPSNIQVFLYGFFDLSFPYS